MVKGFSKSDFNIKGKDAKFSFKAVKVKNYVYKTMLKEEDALSTIEEEKEDLISGSNIKISKPKLKYNIYYRITGKFLQRYLTQKTYENGISSQTVAVLVGDEIFKPSKTKISKDATDTISVVKLPAIELIEVKKNVDALIDGTHGQILGIIPAFLEEGKKSAKPNSWLTSNASHIVMKIKPDRVDEFIGKALSQKPKGAKRIIENELVAKTVLRLIVPFYYFTLSSGEKKVKAKVNALNGMISIGK